MKLPEKPLRIAIVNALAGNIIYNGTPVQVYDRFAANNAVFPRIIITPAIAGPQIGSKISFRANFVQNVKITAAFQDDVTSNPVDDIANQVAQILIPGTTGPYVDLLPDFRVILVTLSGSNDQDYQDQYLKYTDKNLLFNFIIEQTDLL